MAVQYSDSEMLYERDLLTPATGLIRHVALINSGLQFNVPFTVSAATNVITIATAQTFQTGARVRVSSLGTLPTPLVSVVDYFVVRLSSTTFKLASTLANAIAGTEIDLMDGGSGSLVLNEQALLRTDPIGVLLSKEIPPFPGYAERFPIADVGPAAIVQGKAQKTKLIIIVNNGSVDLSIGYYLLIRGGSGTIGNATIAGYGLETLQSILQVTQGETRGLNVVFRGA